MTPSTVCFGAKDDSYGIVRTAISGNITTFKLTYQHGHVMKRTQAISPSGVAFGLLSFLTQWPL